MQMKAATSHIIDAGSFQRALAHMFLQKREREASSNNTKPLSGGTDICDCVVRERVVFEATSVSHLMGTTNSEEQKT